jgi:thiol-disulfide isomerase/thioredoxin
VKRFALACALGALILLPACQQKKAETETPASRPSGPRGGISIIAPAQRQKAGAIETRALDGANWSLSGQAGNVVVIDFWATWCGPCRMTIPHLIEMQKSYGGRGVSIVGISLDQNGRTAVEPFVSQAGINYPILLDPQSRYADLFGGVEGIPTFFLIDRNGRIAARQVGAGPKEALAQAIEMLLSEG